MEEAKGINSETAVFKSPEKEEAKQKEQSTLSRRKKALIGVISSKKKEVRDAGSVSESKRKILNIKRMIVPKVSEDKPEISDS